MDRIPVLIYGVAAYLLFLATLLPSDPDASAEFSRRVSMLIPGLGSRARERTQG